MPNNNNTSNLFALVDDEDALIRRIPLTAAVNTELAQLFAEQQAALLNDRQPIAFTGSYNVDVGEIFTIADYPLPPAIGQAIGNPLICPVLNLNTETHTSKRCLVAAGQLPTKASTFRFSMPASCSLIDGH